MLDRTTEAARILGEKLRERRKNLGINMTSAAEAARISRVTWHRLEKGEVSVALGSLLAAAEVLGMQLSVESGAESTRAPEPGEWLPLRIRLSDYPILRSLAWQVSNDSMVLSPREAFGLYQRNWRHVEVAKLYPHEIALIHGLRELLGGEWPGV